jgi:hypothetical protein
MNGFEPLEPDDDGTVFRDVIMLALLGFVTLVVLLLPHLNPPVEAAQDIDAPGNVVVELRWPDDVDADVDLWVRAPGDHPVGYSNKGGKSFNLLRDDLGHINDPGKLNYEVAYSRGRPAGEYVVNLHLYTNKSHRYPVDAEVYVGIKKLSSASIQRLGFRKVRLLEIGHEITVIRFKLDEDGDLVPGSIHNVPIALRSNRNAKG